MTSEENKPAHDFPIWTLLVVIAVLTVGTIIGAPLVKTYGENLAASFNVSNDPDFAVFESPPYDKCETSVVGEGYNAGLNAEKASEQKLDNACFAQAYQIGKGHKAKADEAEAARKAAEVHIYHMEDLYLDFVEMTEARLIGPIEAKQIPKEFRQQDTTSYKIAVSQEHFDKVLKDMDYVNNGHTIVVLSMLNVSALSGGHGLGEQIIKETFMPFGEAIFGNQQDDMVFILVPQ